MVAAAQLDPEREAAKGRGLTTRDLSLLFRVSEDRIRSWIRAGKLAAINTAEPGRKPRFVSTPAMVAEFEKSRRAADPPKVERRKRRPVAVDFYPD